MGLQGITLIAVIFPEPVPCWDEGLPALSLPSCPGVCRMHDPEAGAARGRGAPASAHTGFASSRSLLAGTAEGSRLFPHAHPPGSSMLKRHDLCRARGCHIRSGGLSDSSPCSTAAPWLLSDKCGSLGLTETNVLVYRSQLSTGSEVRCTSGWLPNISLQPHTMGAGKPGPCHLAREDPTGVSQLLL